ncbi:2-C-methyl-D-erythritol 2,4-cyclodiphosphate synthase [Bacteroidia bacterium]|nr:2-C-methyl-D-erythritol 2,4-cyclodiphosphate synthase [Bacteroidia bacterium]GHV21241.1 2-C-methyl-D-erythritol 2,4-cyclodiphosphate synthase [Bacteroidia bacterium]
MQKIRVGFGYDVHRFVKDRELWIGGILIPNDRGLDGHSDADVLIHAVCDALLGAADLRDIGFQFPDTDPEFKGIDSKVLLSRTMGLIRDKGYEFGNVDVTVCAERPKLNTYIPQMKGCLAGVIGVEPGDISIKATTSEKMGFVGREEGIAAYATVLIYSHTDNNL